MNLQSMFDEIWNWFVVQNHGPSVNRETGSCLYRGPDGRKCAFGVLIPDDKYDPKMESWQASAVIRKFGSMDYLEPYKHKINTLQCIHDDAAMQYKTENIFHKIIKRDLISFAKDNNLTVPI